MSDYVKIDALTARELLRRVREVKRECLVACATVGAEPAYETGVRWALNEAEVVLAAAVINAESRAAMLAALEVYS